jgi:hypothetical protein
MVMRQRRKATHDAQRQEPRIFRGAAMNIWLTGAGARTRLAVAVMALCGGASALAGNLEYQVSLGAGHSDNVTRVPTNEVDEDIASAGLQFAFDEQSKRLQADIVGDLSYREYLDDTYDSELVGNVNADTVFSLLPDRIIWSATDQFGQVLGDPLQPPTPENSENINYFSTGPDFMVGFGSQMRLRVGGRYSLVDYEESPFDSSSTSLEIALVRSISDRSSISLNANQQELEYDEESLNADFDETETFLRYEAEVARTNIALDAGYSRLERDAADDAEGGALLRAEISRRISASSVLLLSGGREFSTAASAFAGDQGISGGGIGTAPGRQTADPFTLDRMNLGWTFSRNVTTVAVNAGWSQRSYEDTPLLDQKINTLSARFRRELSPVTSLALALSRTDVEYEPPATDYADLTGELVFAWRLTRNLTLDVKYDYAKRTSDVPDNEYTENRFWLTIGFGRGDPRTTRIAPTFGVDSMTTGN